MRSLASSGIRLNVAAQAAHIAAGAAVAAILPRPGVSSRCRHRQGLALAHEGHL
jgi:hypothetical protein